MADHQHWQTVYSSKPVDGVSWFQTIPARSLAWILEAVPNTSAAIIDIGAGASSLVDHLLDRNYRNLAVLDIASEALSVVKDRLGERAGLVEWFASDILDFEAPHEFDVWHDRAVMHFLVEPEQRKRYAGVLRQTVRPGGYALIATFAHGGPTRCSGLPVMQSDCGELSELLGDGFECVRDEEEIHLTPNGTEQRFQYCLFARRTA